MKYVKVLDEDLRPPFQGREPYEIGVWNHCENFDTSEKECAPGFYVIPVSELIHYHNPWDDTKVLPVEVKGNSKIFSAAKRRYEYMKLGNPLSDEQIKAMCKEVEPELGYKLSEALYPVNPLLLPKATVTDADIELLKEWYSVRDSLRDSIWYSVNTDSAWYGVKCSVRNSVEDSAWCSVYNSVRDSVKYNVKYSVCDSVRDSVKYSAKHSVKCSVRHSAMECVWDSVRESVWTYIGSLFPSIDKWKYKNREQGNYPFQSAVNLWCRGLVPSFDGKIWRLHSGLYAEVVWEEPEIGWLKAQMEEG